MRPDPRVEALTVARRRPPWGLWTLVVLLAGGAGYAGYAALQAREEIKALTIARDALAANRDSLQTSRMELTRRLEAVREGEAKLRSDLERSRADGDGLADIVAKLQRQVAGLEADLKGARASAEKAVEEVSAKVKLEERLAALEGERDAARAEADKGRQEVERLTGEMARAAEAKAALEREIADLEDELGKVRAQRAPEATGATPSAP